MRLRRALLILLLAAFFTGGLVGGFGWSARNKVTGSSSRATAVKTRPGLRVAGKAEPAAVVSYTRAATTGGESEEPVKLAADETELVAEIAELQIMAQGSEPALDAAQWAKLAAVTLGVQAVRQNFEADIATAKAVAPGRYRVEIPGYAGAGAILRRKFYAQLGRELGDAVAAEVIEKMGRKLEGHFAGFGVSLQTLEIAQPGSADVEITRTVSYWKQAESGEQLVTRRETHLPAWEDPSGERWGALLGVIARAETAG